MAVVTAARRAATRFSEASGHDRDGETALEWLARVLWGPEVEVTVGSEVRPGNVVLERFVAVPTAVRARFLLPAGAPGAAPNLLAAYNRLRPPRIRAARWLVAEAFRLGLAPRLFPDRVTISTPTPEDPDGPFPLLADHLRSVLEENDAVAAIGLRPPGPYTKPVLQLFAPDGRPRAYVKVGWNGPTRAAVRTEARFLEAHGDERFRNVALPRLRHHGRWRDLEISVMVPLPPEVRPYRPRRRPPPPAVTDEIAALPGLRHEPLAAASFWRRLRVLVERGVADRPAAHADVLRACADRIERRHGDVRLTFGSWHGDWVPWNMARDGNRLVVWDWEQRSDDAPRGFDELHFLFQIPFAWRQRTLGEALSEWRARGPGALEAVGVPRSGRPAVMAAYLLELFVRYDAAERAGAGRHPRFFPDIFRALGAEPRSVL
jgi:hypothetical protein